MSVPANVTSFELLSSSTGFHPRPAELKRSSKCQVECEMRTHFQWKANRRERLREIFVSSSK